MRNKILVLAGEIDRHLGLFSDLEHYENCILHYVEYRKIGSFSKILKRIHLSRKLWHWSTTKAVPYQYIWYDYGKDLCLDEISKILIVNYIVDKISLKYLEKCKRKGILIDLLLLDSLNSESLTVIKNRKMYFHPVWDTVFTFDPVDAKAHGFTYRGLCYYSRNRNYPEDAVVNKDVYFTGQTKGGRTDYINRAYRFLNAKGCSCEFDVRSKNMNDERCEGINYLTRWIDYNEILLKLSKCSCILELLQNNQNGPSLRYFEAVFYNKKLITTNSLIKEYPYYNPKWMKIIEKPEDIDIDWLKSHDKVDYNYKGEFSPIGFIEYLIDKNLNK